MFADLQRCFSQDIVHIYVDVPVLFSLRYSSLNCPVARIEKCNRFASCPIGDGLVFW